MKKSSGLPNHETRNSAQIYAAAVPASIVVAGLLLRMYGINATNIWIDEAVSWSQSSAESFLSVIAATAQDNYPPLHNIILHVMTLLFGDSVIALRLPSVFLGTATIYLVYRLGSDLFNRSTGLIAAQLMAVSVFHVWYSIEARMYALLCFMSVVYVWTAFRALRSRSPGSYGVCAVAGVLLLYSHVFGMFVFLAINSAVLLYAAINRLGIPKWLSRWVLSQLAAGLLFLPWAIILLMRAQTSLVTISWIPPVSIEYLSVTFTNLLGGPYMVWAIVLLLLIAFFVTKVVPRASQPDHEQERPAGKTQISLLLVLCWIIVPFVLALSFSLLRTSIIYDRYMIAVLPAFCLLIGFFIDDLLRSQLLKIAAVLLCIVPSLMGFTQLSEPPWRRSFSEEFRTFSELRQPGDVVVILNWHIWTFKYEVRDWKALDVVTDMSSLNDRNVNRFWLLDLGWSQPELVSSITKAGFDRAFSSQKPNMEFSLFVRNVSAPPP